MSTNFDFCDCKVKLRSDVPICDKCGKNRVIEGLTKNPRGNNADQEEEPIYQEVEDDTIRKAKNIKELTAQILRLKDELRDEHKPTTPQEFEHSLEGEGSKEELKLALNAGESARATRSEHSSTSNSLYEEPVDNPSLNQPHEEPTTTLGRNMAELKEFSGLQRSAGLFKGGKDEDVEAYFKKLERWFTLCNWDPEKKARSLSILLEGKAAQMYEALETNTRNNYDLAKDEIIKTFRSNQSHLLRWNNINRLRMETGQSVSEFHQQIQRQAAKIDGITDMNLLNIFLNGLPKRLCEKVAEQDPRDLATALEKALLIESVQIHNDIGSAPGAQSQSKEEHRKAWLDHLAEKTKAEDSEVEKLRKEIKKRDEELLTKIEHMMKANNPSHIPQALVPLPAASQNGNSQNMSTPQDSYRNHRQGQYVPPHRRAHQQPSSGWKPPTTPNGVCFYCGIKGHFKRDCRKFQRDNNPQSNAMEIVTFRADSKLWISVNNNNVLALLDTGSDISIMGAHILKHLNPIPDITEENFSNIIGIGGNKSTIDGIATVQIQLNDFSIDLEVAVLRGTHHDLILGRDFMDRYTINIDWRKKMMTLDKSFSLAAAISGRHETHNMGKLTRDLVLKPHTTQTVELMPSGNIIGEVLIIKGLRRNKDRGIRVHTSTCEGLVGPINCVVENKTHKMIRIRRDTPVAVIKVATPKEPVTTEEQKIHCNAVVTENPEAYTEGVDTVIDTVNTGNSTVTETTPENENLASKETTDQPPNAERESTPNTEEIRRPSFPETNVTTSAFEGNSPTLADKPTEISTEEVASSAKNGESKPSPTEEISTEEKQRRLEELLERYPDAFADTDYDMGCSNVIQHKIDVGEATPIKARAYRVNPSTQQVIDEHIDNLLECGIIRPSISPWSSPVIVVGKKDGSTRMCIDYRQLNKLTRKDSYPLPVIQDVLDCLAGSKYFTTLDLRQGFYQLEVHENSKHLTAFVSKRGLYEFNRLPFGLCNSPASFVRMMEEVFRDTNWRELVCYLDDIIIFSDTFETHLERLERVFKKLITHNLKLKRTKCVFLKQEVEFLGFTVSGKGLAPNEKKVEVINNHPAPKDRKELKAFLGGANYYRKFIENFSQIAHPMHELLKKDIPYIWSKECEEAFQTIKTRLTSSPILDLPNFDTDFILYTDASGFAIGYILGQINEGRETVVCYAGRSLSTAERNYSVGDLETLAVVAGVKYYSHYLSGRRFKIYTDNTSVAFLLNLKNPTGRLARWLVFLQSYDFEIVYKPGASHGNADAVSRITNLAVNSAETNKGKTEDEKSLHKMQMEDPVLKPMINYLKDGDAEKLPEKGKVSKQTADTFTLTEDLVLMKKANENKALRTVIPATKVRDVLADVHDGKLGGHYGISKTYLKVSTKYWWPNAHKEVKQWCESCETCALNKPDNRPTKAPMIPIKPKAMFEFVSLDICGPFPKTIRGNKYIICFIDLFSKYVEAIPLPATDAPLLAQTFFDHVVARHGVPSRILSDQGSNLVGKILTELCAIMGIQKLRTSPYHPACNGAVERFNQTLGGLLRRYAQDNQERWDDFLPGILFSYHNTVHRTTNFTPFFLAHGRHPRTPVDLDMPRSDYFESHKDLCNHLDKNLKAMREEAKTNIEQSQEKTKEQHDTKSTAVKFKVGDRVLLKVGVRKVGKCHKLQPKWEGPFTLEEQKSPVNFKLGGNPGSRKTGKIVHVNRLKAFRGGMNETPTDKRGNEKVRAKDTPKRGEKTVTFSEEDTETTDPSPKRTSKSSSIKPKTPTIIGEETQQETPLPEATIEKHRRTRRGIEYYTEGRWYPAQTILRMVKEKSLQEYLKAQPTPTKSNKDLEIEAHRNHRQKLQFQVDGRWLTRQEVFEETGNQWKVEEYLQRVQRRSSRHNRSEAHASTAQKTNKVRKSFGVRNLKYWLLWLIFGALLTKVSTQKEPQLGKLFDCSVATHSRIYALPEPINCGNFNAGKVQRFKAKVEHYDPQETEIRLYRCTAEKVTLKCSERSFGSVEKSQDHSKIDVTPRQCKDAVYKRKTPYGGLHLKKRGIWTTESNKRFKCRWERTTLVAFVIFSVQSYWGKIKGTDPVLHQKVTNTKCDYRTRQCRPVEDPHSLIVWREAHNHRKNPYKTIGHYEATQVHKFVLLHEISTGGSIIRETKHTKMLDNGYLLTLNNSKTKFDKQLNDFARNYSRRTKTSAQREILEGKIGLEILRQNQFEAMMSSSVCQLDRKIKAIERWLLKEFPDTAAEFLFPGEGKEVVELGDGGLVRECREVIEYKVKWDRRINSSCYDLIPVNSSISGEGFLELRTKRILPSASKIPCVAREEYLYIKDKQGDYWEYSLQNGFKRLSMEPWSTPKKKIVLPTLRTFNEHIFYLRKQKPHRVTLLRMVAQQEANLHAFNNFQEDGGGSITEGIAQAISGAISGVTKAGSELISSITKGIERDTEGAGKAASQVIGTTLGGVAKVVQSLGGWGTIILIAIDMGIIGYLMYLRRGGNRAFRPPIPRHKTPSIHRIEN